jgi:hypothetical protein
MLKWHHESLYSVAEIRAIEARRRRRAAAGR